uniref:Putative LOC100569746 [Acyrthosiphon pisum] n=1 Tax=Lepeophtheirus salmonis TaxID=72036 RepID=A0A0K2UL39_LEPSM
MVTDFLVPQIEVHGLHNIWFQQDGATCHTARVTMDLLGQYFDEQLISHFGPVNWAPSSCDITPLDFFFFRPA